MNIKTQRNFDQILPNNDPTYRASERAKIEQQFSAFIQKRKENSDYLQDASSLKSALDDYEKLMWGYGPGGDDFGVFGTESFYFRLQKTIHSEDETFLSGANKADEFAVKMQNEILFFELALSTISSDKQSEFLSSPLLAPYRHFLEKRFEEGKHLLAPESEKILNILSKTSYENRATMTEQLTSKYEGNYPEGEKSETVYFEMLLDRCSDQNSEKRKRASTQINAHLKTLEPLAEHELNSILEFKKEIDKLRNFSYPEASTYLRDDIDKEVVEAMASAVENCYSFSQQFYTLKAKLLGLSHLTYEEKNLKYGSSDAEYSFEKAVEIVDTTLQELDPEFWQIFQSFLQNGQIDVYPNKWKRGGAFCTDSSKALPVYIMLNYTKKLRDISTIIHEMGHGINAVLQRKQNALNYGATVSTAEVASTFFENVLIRKLSQSLSGEELLVFRMSVLDDMVSTVQRQIACFRFEQALHQTFRQEGYLTSKKIWLLFQSHMKNYMGDATLFGEWTENRRICWSHIRNFFYVYSYASGFLISKSMEALLHSWKISITHIKDFLSAGMNSSPRETFLQMGIDIANPDFRKAGLQEMQTYLEETISLAKTLGKY